MLRLPQLAQRPRLFRIVRPGMSRIQQPTDEDLFYQVRLVSIDLLLAPNTEAIHLSVGFYLEDSIDIAGQHPAHARGRASGQRGKDLLELRFGNHTGAGPSIGLRTGLLHNRTKNEIGQTLEALHAV